MPGFDGTGPRGMGPMTGGGRGFCSSWGVGANPSQYRYPRRMAYSHPGYGAYGFQPYPRMTRAQELESLKNNAQVLRDELKDIEAEINRLSAEK